MAMTPQIKYLILKILLILMQIITAIFIMQISCQRRVDSRFRGNDDRGQ